MGNQNDQELSSTRYVISASNLPLLTGSEDQIAWAKTIRIDMLVLANHLLAQVSQDMLNETIRASQVLQNTTSAAWWISHRDHAIEPLLQKLSQRSYTLEFAEPPPSLRGTP